MGGVTSLISVEILLYAILKHGGVAEIQSSIFGMTYNNPLVILQSVICFCIFLTLHFTNRAVNWLAGSALSIYLLHMHPGWKQQFYDLAESLYAYTVFSHYILQFALIVSVCVAAVLIDKVRIFCFEWGYPIILKSLKK